MVWAMTTRLLAVEEEHTPVPAPPTTGHPAIDAALSGLELGPNVHTHHDALAAAVEVVQHALNPAAQGPRPHP